MVMCLRWNISIIQDLKKCLCVCVGGGGGGGRGEGVAFAHSRPGFPGPGVYIGRRVISVVEHSSANPKVPGLIPGPVSYRGHGL